MNEIIQQFVRLTQLDHELVQLREQLARYPAMLAQMAASDAAEQRRIEEYDAELKSARLARSATEKEVAALREKAHKYTAQQATVKTNKEYEAMTHEIEQVHARIDELETRGLEALLREEALTDRRTAARKKLEVVTADHATERKRIEGQTSEKRERAERLTSERARRVEELPEEWRDPYELLNEHFPGSACAALDGESCSGCHWHLVAHTCQRVHAGADIVECDHCRRIVYDPKSVTS